MAKKTKKQVETRTIQTLIDTGKATRGVYVVYPQPHIGPKMGVVSYVDDFTADVVVVMESGDRVDPKKAVVLADNIIERLERVLAIIEKHGFAKCLQYEIERTKEMLADSKRFELYEDLVEWVVDGGPGMRSWDKWVLAGKILDTYSDDEDLASYDEALDDE